MEGLEESNRSLKLFVIKDDRVLKLHEKFNGFIDENSVKLLELKTELTEQIEKYSTANLGSKDSMIQILTAVKDSQD